MLKYVNIQQSQLRIKNVMLIKYYTRNEMGRTGKYGDGDAIVFWSGSEDRREYGYGFIIAKNSSDIS